ncbi:tigger transposable element-derived protein 1-like [Anopheles funestus]|uniref:tigger transposable element-derived protein 1-like n=1 Tax=Anopheles funestus TaxID=62324 RepID=UPI0020C72B23|nr:tigger transposable element-derived protein 1-like [Anopheles funestus]
MVLEKGYIAEQIFNVDETAFFWKKMPSRSYITKQMEAMPGYKPAKDRITIMVGGNLAGDLKLKPLAVYRCRKPRAFKNIDAKKLPVVWKWNSKAWATRSIFVEWFHVSFIPEVQQYCAKKDIPFKALLLLDNVHGHPTELNDLHPNIEVIFLPPRTTCLLQPMDQGIIATLKSYYLRRVFKQAIETIENVPEITLIEFWKKFNIFNAIQNISEAWKEVKQETMNGCWKKIIPDYFIHSDCIDNQIHNSVEECVELANRLEIEVNIDEMRQLIVNAGETLSNEKLIQESTLEALENCEGDDNSEDVPCSSKKNFTAKKLELAFSYMEKALSAIEEMDEDEERFNSVMLDTHQNRG